MQRGVANKSRTIRIPVHIADREQRRSRAPSGRWSPKLGRQPTDEEIAEHAKLPLKQVREVRQAARAITSLDKPLGVESEGALGDLFARRAGAEPEEELTVSLGAGRPAARRGPAAGSRARGRRSAATA